MTSVYGKVLSIMIAVATFFLWNNSAYSAHRYISTTGSNGASGTDAGNAWQTFAYARTNYTDWDTLYIMGGQWEEFSSGEHYPAPNYGVTFRIDFSGTDSSNPRVLTPAPGYDSFEVRGYHDSAYTAANPPMNGAIWIDGGVHDIVINRARVKYASSGICLGAEGGGAPINRITIKNSVVCSTGNIAANNAGENNGGVCTATSPVKYLTVDHCTLYTNWESPTSTGVNAGGIWLYTTSYSTFTNNVIWDEGGPYDYYHGAIMLKNRNNASDTGSMSYNDISYNKIYDSNIGIRLYHLANDNDVHHNLIWNCNHGIEISGPWIDGGYGCTNNNNNIYNNTLYNCGPEGILTFPYTASEGTIDSPRFWNNIVYTASGSAAYSSIWNDGTIRVTNRYADYNCYYSASGSSIIRWGNEGSALIAFSTYVSTYGFDTHSLNANPYFLSTTYGNANFLRLDTLNSPEAALSGGYGGVYPEYMGALDPFENSATGETTIGGVKIKLRAR